MGREKMGETERLDREVGFVVSIRWVRDETTGVVLQNQPDPWGLRNSLEWM